MNQPLLISLSLALLAPAWNSARGLEIDGLPKPAEARPVTLIQPAEKTLANGLRVIVIERPYLPLLSAELLVKTGCEADPPKLAGLAKLAASLLTQGTTTRSAPQIAREIEALGASLSSEAGWDASLVKLNTLSANAEPALKILADVVCRPQFAAEEIGRQRRQALDELRLTLEEPGPLARAVAARVILDPSPYAHPPSGTLASLPRIQRPDLKAFHQSHFRPANAVLILAGQVTAAEGFVLAEKAFGPWAAPAPVPARTEKGAVKASKDAAHSGRIAATPPLAAIAPVPPVSGVVPRTRVILVDLPEAGQAAVYVGAPSLLRRDPDYVIGEVTNTVLGGGYSSRLNQEIRVKRGLSYGAGSRLTAGRATGLFGAACQTKNESAAQVVRVILDELGQVGREPVSEEYFASRRAVLTGNFARELATNEGYAARISELALHDLPLSTLNERFHQLNAVTAEDARRFAADHLAPGTMSIIVVGRGKELKTLLRKDFPQLEVVPQEGLDLEKASLGRTPARGK